MYKPINAKMNTGDYAVPGGYHIYIRDMKEFENNYKSVRGKGIKVVKSR